MGAPVAATLVDAVMSLVGVVGWYLDGEGNIVYTDNAPRRPAQEELLVEVYRLNVERGVKHNNRHNRDIVDSLGDSLTVVVGGNMYAGDRDSLLDLGAAILASKTLKLLTVPVWGLAGGGVAYDVPVKDLEEAHALIFSLHNQAILNSNA